MRGDGPLAGLPLGLDHPLVGSRGISCLLADERLPMVEVLLTEPGGCLSIGSLRYP